MRGRLAGRRSGGYTLVEVVVVVGLVALAAAVVAPSLWRPEARAEAAAISAVAELYAVAREAAVERGGQAEVRLRLDDGRWVTLARDGRSEMWDTVGRGDLEPADLDFRFAGNGWAVVRFDARGRAVGDAVGVDGPRGGIVLRPDPWRGELHVSRR